LTCCWYPVICCSAARCSCCSVSNWRRNASVSCSSSCRPYDRLRRGGREAQGGERRAGGG
jgi:hypothetical protein